MASVPMTRMIRVGIHGMLFIPTASTTGGPAAADFLPGSSSHRRGRPAAYQIVTDSHALTLLPLRSCRGLDSEGAQERLVVAKRVGAWPAESLCREHRDVVVDVPASAGSIARLGHTISA